jgi:hypothetical protein
MSSAGESTGGVGRLAAAIADMGIADLGRELAFVTALEVGLTFAR